MAVSTERTVRDVLVAAIRGVAGQLGFAEPQGNVRDYLIENHQAEQEASYLAAKVGSEQIPRAWGVEVLGYDEPFAMQNVAKRTYEVTISGYYLKGVNGKGWNDLIDGARVIRGAINAISPRWSDTVTRIVSASQLNRGEIEADGGALVVGVMRYVAERTNPDFTV